MTTTHQEQPSKTAGRVLIVCDFDGTVSTKDTVGRLIGEHITSQEWRFHVKRYYRDEIGSKGVYEAVAPHMRMTRGDLEDFVRTNAALDPWFPSFLEWADSRGIDVKIVSDGFDATIEALFRNHGINGLDVFANNLILDETGQVTIRSPHYNPDCGICGTCKLAILRKFRADYDRIILIGDGESDRHAASEADMVLALQDLFVYCAGQGIPAIRIEGFGEVPRLLTRRIQAVTFDMDGTLVDSLEGIAESFNHMFVRLGYPLMNLEQVVRLTAISLKDFVQSYLKPEETEIGINIFREYHDKVFREKTKMVPGAMETLNALNGTVIQGIVTNKRGKYARLLAEHFGIADRMARIIGAEDGFRAKPAPDMFHEFIRSTGAASQDTIYVGDAPVDIQAAHNAGLDAFGIVTSIFSGAELALHCPRRVLSSISELPAALGPIL
jgi:2-hydroxy-3-keto-5-methylthiopentenyl-1-phosphate phosphatase